MFSLFGSQLEIVDCFSTSVVLLNSVKSHFLFCLYVYNLLTIFFYHD